MFISIRVCEMCTFCYTIMFYLCVYVEWQEKCGSQLISISMESLNILSRAINTVFIGEIIFWSPNVPIQFVCLLFLFRLDAYSISLSFTYHFQQLSWFLLRFLLKSVELTLVCLYVIKHDYRNSQVAMIFIVRKRQNETINSMNNNNCSRTNVWKISSLLTSVKKRGEISQRSNVTITLFTFTHS